MSASFVLGSSKFSTYPLGKRAVWAARGRAGEKRYAFGFDSPAALLDGHFEHPAGYAPDVPRVRNIEGFASIKEGS